MLRTLVLVLLVVLFLALSGLEIAASRLPPLAPTPAQGLDAP
jgi:hypothetical protein